MNDVFTTGHTDVYHFIFDEYIVGLFTHTDFQHRKVVCIYEDKPLYSHIVPSLLFGRQFESACYKTVFLVESDSNEEVSVLGLLYKVLPKRK